jgi:hypothetical protein
METAREHHPVGASAASLEQESLDRTWRRLLSTSTRVEGAAPVDMTHRQVQYSLPDKLGKPGGRPRSSRDNFPKVGTNVAGPAIVFLTNVEGSAKSRSTRQYIRQELALQPNLHVRPMRAHEALAAIRSFRTGDQAEQAAALARLKQDLDEGRPEGQKLFPDQ